MSDVPVTQRREARAGVAARPRKKPRTFGLTPRMVWLLQYMDKHPEGINGAEGTEQGRRMLTAYRDTFLPDRDLYRARMSVWRAMARLEFSHLMVSSELTQDEERTTKFYNVYKLNARGREVVERMKALQRKAA